jgi:transposase-like protein
VNRVNRPKRGKKMSEAATPVAHRRQSKFTPANVRQIVNLLERGKSKVEIAEIIGVTPATLQVTCSKLGISLRRPVADASSGGSRARRRPQNGKVPDFRGQGGETAQPEGRNESPRTAPERTTVEENQTIVRLHPKQPVRESVAASSVSLTVRYKGEERTIELPIDRDALGLFALEAQFRSIGIGDLIGGVLLSIAKHDLFESVLEPSRGRAR